MGQFFILCSRVQQEYNSLLANALNRIQEICLWNEFQMGAYKTGAFVRSEYYTPF